MQSKELLKQQLKFKFDKGFETTVRWPTMQGQKIVETTDTFSI